MAETPVSAASSSGPANTAPVQAAKAPDQSKVTAFQLALQAALQRPPVLADGGGSDVDDNDDGTSLTIRQGIGFPTV